MNFVRSDAVEKIRQKIDHPVIDGDGHVLEYYPVVRDLLVEEAGESVAKRADVMMSGSGAIRDLPRDQMHHFGAFRATWWGVPSENTLDRATAIAPDLMHARLDELGVDFALLFGTSSLGMLGNQDEELRRALARANNRYYAELFCGHRDRMEPVAVIPMVTPDEAIAELDYAIGELGLKAIVMAGLALRPLPGAEDVPGAKWIDTLAHDSDYDYDPVWARCEELGVSPTFHQPGLGWGSRVSRKSYVYNHLGHFAAAGEATCRSIFLGGVPKRFPKLRFAFLEGGVAWGLSLYSAMFGLYEKRGKEGIEHLNPANLDRPLLLELLEEYGSKAIRERLDRIGEGSLFLSDPKDPGGDRDEFAESGISGPDDIEEIFTRRFYFGCEADDPMNALAFSKKINPRGAELQALFASDIGHWDVPDFRGILPEAWELVERDLLDMSQFRAFMCDNTASLLTATNPDFFAGTVIEDSVKLKL
ncbi:MAG: amidohydrolase family protein [Deltaproteobacteria bacterium]|nr:amidohydrolase family protein [Deltaproteobacteria bacterium]